VTLGSKLENDHLKTKIFQHRAGQFILYYNDHMETKTIWFHFNKDNKEKENQ